MGREYEPIIRINSQSGKGGSAFVMQHSFGFDLPKAMHPEFGHIVQVETDRVGKELKPDAIYDLFKAHYIDCLLYTSRIASEMSRGDCQPLGDAVYWGHN